MSSQEEQRNVSNTVHLERVKHFRIDDARLAVWNAKPTPNDGSDEAWALVAPYLTLLTAETPQRAHLLREVCNGRRGIGRAGAARCRHLARNYKQLTETLAGLHCVAFAILMHKRVVELIL